jgi:hypothetical protein
MSKPHAERNEKLSNILFDENIVFEGKKFFDWVVTVSFYSAIHFVESHLLPCVISRQHCNNINDVKKAYAMAGRHAARERLVWEKMTTTTAAYYKWLDDKSRYSRYTTYKVTVAEAAKAQQYLKSIKTECFPNP